MEITAVEQNIEKRMKKKNEPSLRDLWTVLNTPTFALQGSQKEKRERERRHKKIFEEIIAENFPNIGREIIKYRKKRESQAG